MTEMDRRIELQQKFEDILGSKKVYFQPPETMKLQYPCILYFKTSTPANYADDLIYKYKQGYTVTVVDSDPDSEIPFTLLKALPYSKIDSFYKSEGLNHTKLTIFY